MLFVIFIIISLFSINQLTYMLHASCHLTMYYVYMNVCYQRLWKQKGNVTCYARERVNANELLVIPFFNVSSLLVK